MASFVAPKEFQAMRQQKKMVPYFPPPPGTPTTTATKKKLTGRSSIPLTLKIPGGKQQQPARKTSLRHTIGQSSVARKRRLAKTLDELPLPAIHLSTRHWILLALFLLSFLCLVLGFIYADCVALPHTNDTREEASIFNATGNSTDSNSNSYSNSYSNSTDAHDADETRRLGFDLPKNLVILFFYTATLPLATMGHVVLELALAHYAKKRTSHLVSDEVEEQKQKIRPFSLAQNHSSATSTTTKSSSSSSSKFAKFLSLLPALSLTTTLLLVSGWVVINAIQAHCELPIPTPTSSFCPIQTRGHYMRGIHELSIVKNLMGWVLVLVYLLHAGRCAKIVRVVSGCGRGRAGIKEMEGEGVGVVRVIVLDNKTESKKEEKTDRKGQGVTASIREL